MDEQKRYALKFYIFGVVVGVVSAYLVPAIVIWLNPDAALWVAISMLRLVGL